MFSLLIACFKSHAVDPMMTSALVTLLADIAALNTVAMDQLVELRAGALIGYETCLIYFFALFVFQTIGFYLMF